MRCGRAERVELDAFLLGATGDEALDAFRAHYPHCADCAAVVAEWMALDSALREAAAEAGESVGNHPDPEDLVRYAEAPSKMGAKAMQIENHMAACPTCASELKLIQVFDPALFGSEGEAMPAAVREPLRQDPGIADSVREALAGFVEKLRGFDLLSPAPALATALLLLAGLWWSGALEGLRTSQPESSGPPLVQRTAPAAKSPSPELDGGGAPGSLTPGRSPELAPEPQATEPMLAEQTQPSESSEPTAAPSSSDEPKLAASPEPVLEQAAPVEVAQAATEAATESAPAPGMPESRPPVRPVTPRPPEEVLLAAVSALPPPSYATPEGAESVVWMRQFGAVRSAPGTAKVMARAPGSHTGLTLSRSPRLWWALDQGTDLPIQITIVDGEAIDPAVRVELPGPHAAGLHAFDLSSRGVELSPDVDYRWFVAIVVDPDRPSRNPVSAGSLRAAGAADARRASVDAADAAARGNRFAELGLWYDAFDFYASLAQAHPEVEQLATYRDRLGAMAE